MKSLNKRIAMGLVAAGVGLGVSVFLWWKCRKEDRREQLLARAPFYSQVLRKLRREFYPAFEMVRGLTKDIQLRRSRIPDQQMIDVAQEVERTISRPDSTFNQLVRQAEEQVFEEFNITDRVQFEKDCKELAALDLHVRFLWTDIKNMQRRARAGDPEIAPISAEVLNRLSKQLTFQTHKQLVWEEVQALHAAPAHRPNWTAEEHRQAIANLELGKTKLEVLDQNGFNNDEDVHPQHLFSAALTHFSTLDNYFRVNIEALDTILTRVREDFRKGTLRATPLASIRADIDWVILN